MRRIPFAGTAALLTVAAMFCLFAPRSAPASSGADEAERAAIAKVIDTYIEGGRKGRGAIMKEAFHEGATIYSVRGGGPILLLFDLVDSKPPAITILYEITNLEVEGTIAMARVDIPNWSGTHYTDMFTLLKTDAGWRIVNKVSHIHTN